MRIFRAPAFVSSLCVAVAVIVANAVYLLGVRSNNPVLYYSGLGSPTRGVVAGSQTIDANVGWTAQALGRLAAQMWQHGHLPLWNYYEGLGQPLAGEMQSAALFQPFILLQLLPDGIFLMHLSLELVAAFGTLLFLRSLRLCWPAAVTGACLFGLNGSFSVMTNAPFNPIAFLPAALWGVELIREGVQDGRRPRAGIWVTALAIAYMLFAGFPETALLEGLFVLGWALIRLPVLRDHRRSFVAWTVVGALIGVAIAAPILITFKDFLDFGYAAYHSGAANAYSYPRGKITSLALPYAVAPGGHLNPIFDGQAGYLTLPAVLVAIVGFGGKRGRAVQVFLGSVVVVLVLNMFGFTPVKEVLNVVPGVRNILVAKYGLSVIEFAVLICVAFGIDHLRRVRVRRWTVPTAAALTVCYLLGSFGYAMHRNVLIHPRWTTAMVLWTVTACVALGLLFLLGKSSPKRAGVKAMLAAAIVILDATGTYAVPQLSASTPHAVDLAPVHYLQSHLGTSRFYTLGPIQPNYGSYWGIASINVDDLPVPAKYSSFLTDRLSPAPGTPGARGTKRSFFPYELVALNAGTKTERILLQAYGQQQKYFRAAGVKFVVMRRDVATPSTGPKYGLTRVFQDARFEIWQDTKAAPYYSTSGAKCSLHDQSLSAVTLSCDVPATLLRRELSTSDWTVSINGASRTVADSPGRLFQSVRVPAGVSTVSYSYMPRHFVQASVVSLGLVAMMFIDGGAFLIRRRRRLGDKLTPHI